MTTDKSKILIVDDTEENIDLLVGILGDEYNISFALDGSKALEIVEEDIPDLILLDVMMPKIDGYNVCRALKKNKKTMKIPVVFLTALGHVEDELIGLELGAVDYITKPFNPVVIKSRVKNHLLLKKHQDRLDDLVKVRTYELELTQDVLIKSLGILAEYRDPETGGHIKRTQNYMRLMSNHLKTHENFRAYLDDECIELLYKSAPLHDVGKVGVRDSILLKPGKLTPEEFVEMKKHVTYGRDAIASARKELGKDSFLKYAEEIAYSHHEKWDGTGYPLGLKGEEIPISGRLMAIADVYDALISKRIYKPSFSHAKAKSIIIEGRGTQFDPEVLDAFIELEEEFRQTAMKYADFDEEIESLKD